LFLIFLIMVLGDLVVQIPMPVLVGIMIMVSVGTFDWSSFSYLKKAPKGDAMVMLLNVVIVVATHDLSKGVIAGVLLSAIFFVAKISNIKVTKQLTHQQIHFTVEGQLFFASVEGFIDAFDFAIEHTNIVIDFSDAHIWDDSAVGAIDKVVMKYRERENIVTITNLNTASRKLIEKLAVSHDANAKLSS
jgi:sulfate permease, SulP family